jgi:hypothetical protein
MDSIKAKIITLIIVDKSKGIMTKKKSKKIKKAKQAINNNL